MRNALMLAVVAFALPAAAETADWKEWAPILGAWEADAGPPGTPTGGYVLGAELGDKVLVRRSHSEAPSSHHEDLTVIYRDGTATRADYWDNEGHLIRYAVTVEAGKSYTFLSDAAPGRPRFRLTYVPTGPKALAIRFEIAPPGPTEQWKKYLEATMHRAAP